MPNLFIKTEVYQPSYITYLFGFIPSSSPQFVIAGGAPNGRVSWQVTGIRHDPLIEQHPIIPEVKKDDTTVVPKGVCLFKPLCL